MEVSYHEWWSHEVTQRFESFLYLMQKYLLGSMAFKLCVLLVGAEISYLHLFMLMVCGLFACGGSLLRASPPVWKIACIVFLSEMINSVHLYLAQTTSKDHEVLHMFGCAVILLCVELAFVSSSKVALVFIVKFLYQWHFSLVFSGTVPSANSSSPYSAVLAGCIFYYFYRSHQEDYSFKLYSQQYKLKKHKERASILLRMFSDGLLILSSEKEVLLTNENILTYFGTTQENLLEALRVLVYVPGKKMNNLTDSMHLIHDISEVFSLQELVETTLGVTRSGNEFLEWRVKRISWVGSEAMILTCRNVNQLIHLEEESVKQSLLQSVSHDLKTPSETISSFSTQIMEKEQSSLSSKSMEKLEIINLSAKLLLSLVNDILDYSKIVKGMFTINRSACVIEKLVKECCSIISSHAQRKNIELIKRIEPGLPIVYTDATRFQQILLNLLSNAVKFTTHGFIEVCVYQGHQSKVKVEVNDTGTGISEDGLANMFKPHSSLRDPVHNKHGCGIGLNIANILAKELGGSDIKVKSQLNIGSSFMFSVFFSGLEEDEFSESECSSTVSEHKNQITMYSSLKLPVENSSLLVVDDDPYMLLILKETLEEIGVSFCQSQSGENALKIIQAKAETFYYVRVVLLDKCMPGLDGIQTSQKIVQMFRNEEISYLPVIVGYTADVSEEIVAECKEAGMAEIIKKPATVEVLRNTLSKYL